VSTCLTTRRRRNENTTTFAGCREYRAESSVSFTAPEPDAGSSRQSAPAAQVRVPADLQFTLELTAPITSLTIQKQCFFIVDKSTFGQDEVQAMLVAGTPTV
jgi:hypothetical protein